MDKDINLSDRPLRKMDDEIYILYNDLNYAIGVHTDDKAAAQGLADMFQGQLRVVTFKRVD